MPAQTCAAVTTVKLCLDVPEVEQSLAVPDTRKAVMQRSSPLSVVTPTKEKDIPQPVFSKPGV